MNYKNILHSFVIKADELGDKPFLFAKRGDIWQPITWNETRERIESLAFYLAGLPLGANPKIMIIMENRPEYLIASYSIMAMGGVITAAMPLASADTSQYIMHHSGARAVVISNIFHYDKVKEYLRQNPMPVICCDGDSATYIRNDNPQLPVVNLWQLPAQKFDLAGRAGSVNLDDTVNIIYTSGTGGTPKGVMLSYRNIQHNMQNTWHIFMQLPGFTMNGERFLSFLPFAHSYEFMCVISIATSLGAEIYCVESLDKIAQYMVEVKPTIMSAVPRLYETMRGKIQLSQNQLTGFKKTMFETALRLGYKRIDKQKLSPFEYVLDILVDTLVRNKVRARFGGQLKTFISGGGRLDPGVGRYLVALGIPILQGYGLSETSPVVSVNAPLDWRVETAGPVLPNTQVKFADDGEILVHGDLVMQGYWRDEQATAQVITPDGWLKTGDIGFMDGNHLRITDRKKDMIKNRGGENIAPQKLEGFLNLTPEISQSLVYGEGQNYITALLVINKENCEGLSQHEIDKRIQANIENINKRLDKHEIIKKYIYADEPFTIANGLMSPTLKIKRNEVLKIYGARLRGLY